MRPLTAISCLELPLSVRLDTETEKKLEEVADALDRPKGWVVREAIRHYAEAIADYDIALERLADPDGKLIDHEEAKHALGLVDSVGRQGAERGF